MAGIQSKSVSFDSVSIGSEIKFLTYAQLEVATKWLSCNGDFLGVGPTLVFASAAALFLYHELEATIYMSGDHPPVSSLEKTLVSTMVLGILALMVHIWVCAMRFFQYYLDSIIKDSPDVLLQMTTAGLLGYKPEIILGPLTKFLRYQQPQIHITVCWFLSLCYADYVRKNYCQTFNMPYLEQWQSQLHERVSLGVHSTVARINSFVSHVNMRLRGFTDPETSSHSCQPPTPSSTVTPTGAAAGFHARPTHRRDQFTASCRGTGEVPPRCSTPSTRRDKRRSSAFVTSADRQTFATRLRNCICMFRLLGALAIGHSNSLSTTTSHLHRTSKNPIPDDTPQTSGNQTSKNVQSSRNQPSNHVCSVRDSDHTVRPDGNIK